MNDPELERLKRTPVPEPAPGAEDRARLMAMDAFDETQAQKNAARLKGTAAQSRLTSDRPFRPWRMFMQNRLALGGAAAALAVVPLSAVLLTQHDFRSPEISQRPPAGDRQAAVEKAPPPAEPMVKQEAARVARDAEASPPTKPVMRQEAARAAQDAGASPPPPPSPAPASQGLASGERLPAPSNEAPKVSTRSIVTPSKPGQGEYFRFGGGDGAWARDDTRHISNPDRDRFTAKEQNGVKVTADDPVSTFSIDADTASYSWMRRSLMAGRMPSPDAVRVEELINYFPYDYPGPDSADVPFRPTVSVAPAPWSRDNRVVRIGIKGFEAPAAVRPKANLVFLVDVSGSMSSPDKLPLVQASLKLLLNKLAPDDSVSLVTYASGVGVALEPTRAAEREKILGAIDQLQAGGSTAGAAGIDEAYRLARRNFDPKGVNRVLIATDGDFNVGTSDDDGLTRLIEEQRRSGVFLSVLGFGQGNYNDALMQRLAQNGNGTAAYIDQLEEAQKVLVEEATSTLFPIAKDVKIQVEFNPASVAEYRLIGYETRALAREDFRNDKVDAGEVGSGSTVTALYEITPVGSPARMTDDLRYGGASKPAKPAADADEFGYLKIRYKLPDEEVSREISQPIGKALDAGDFSKAPDDMRFAAAVAAFGQKLKGGKYGASLSYEEIAALANGAKGDDRWGYRAGFVRLVGLAKALSGGK